MNIKKILILLILILVSGIVVFYFWAQSSKYNSDEYNEIDHFSASQGTNKDTLRIMTYNLGYLSGMTNNLAVDLPESLVRSNLNKAQSLIGELDLDIIAFQEIDFNSSRSFFINQYQELAHACSFTSGAMAVNWDKKYVPFPYWPFKYHFGSMYSGQAILSNFEIISNDRIVLPKPESNAFYYNAFYLDRLAQCVWMINGGDSLLLINVHFEAWDIETRETQAEIILEKIKQFDAYYPIILLGDFNCRPPFDDDSGERTLGILLDHPSLSMVTSKEDDQTNTTADYTFSSKSPYEKIDYILYNNRFFDPIESKVIQEAGEISDHLPLFSSLVYKDKQ